MKKKALLVLFLILSLLLTACSNPEGGFGPSWDITAKIPLIKGSEENKITVYDLLGEDVNLEEGISISLADGEDTLYDLGGELSTVSLDIGGGTLELSLLPVPPDITVADDLGEIKIDTQFSRLVLGENLATVTIEPLDKVDFQDIKLYIFDDGQRQDPYEIPIGADGKGQWQMDGLVFSSNDILIAAVADSANIGEVTVSIDLPDKLLVESITCDVGESLADKDTTINFELDLDLDEKIREELEKVEFWPELVLNLATLEGLEINIKDLVFTTRGAKPEVITTKIEGTGSKKTVELNGKSLLDLLRDPGITGFNVSANYSITGEEVTVNRTSKVGIEAIRIQIPYEFSVKEDIVYQVNGQEVGSLDQDTRELLQNRLEAALVIEDLYNNFPFSVEIGVYLASISGNPTEEFIEENLYTEANKIKSISIEQRTGYKSFPVKLASKELEPFAQEDLYAGVKIIIPRNATGETYKFNEEDEFTFNLIYISLTGKINGGEEK